MCIIHRILFTIPFKTHTYKIHFLLSFCVVIFFFNIACLLTYLFSVFLYLHVIVFARLFVRACLLCSFCFRSISNSYPLRETKIGTESFSCDSMCSITFKTIFNSNHPKSSLRNILFFFNIKFLVFNHNLLMIFFWRGNKDCIRILHRTHRIYTTLCTVLTCQKKKKEKENHNSKIMEMLKLSHRYAMVHVCMRHNLCVSKLLEHVSVFVCVCLFHVCVHFVYTHGVNGTTIINFDSFKENNQQTNK